MQGLHNMYAAWLYPQHSSTPSLLTLTQAGNDKQRHHRGPKDLSDEPHYSPEAKHNPDYDHEAFLGKEQAERFDQLPPEEARRRLGCVCMTVTYLSMAALYTHCVCLFFCPAHHSVIVDKTDKNGDGQVTQDELRDWVHHVAQK